MLLSTLLVLVLSSVFVAGTTTHGPRQTTSADWAVVTSTNDGIFVPTITVPSFTSSGTPLSLSSQAPATIAQSNSSEFGISLVKKLIDDTGIPERVNLTCRNCSTAGRLEFADGGYDSNDNALLQAASFFEDGFLQFQAHNMGGNFTFDLALAPGLLATNFQVPLNSVPIQLFTAKLGNFATADLSLDIFLPMNVQTNVAGHFSPSLTFSIPDNSTVYLNISDPESSYITGFNNSRITPSISFNIPNATIHIVTGVDFVIKLDLTAGNSSEFNFNGDLALSLGLPLVNISASALRKVNATCDRPAGSEQTFEHAVAVSYDTTFAANLTGGISADLAGWEPGWQVPHAGFGYDFHLDSTCLTFDSTESSLVPVTAQLAPAQFAPTSVASGSTAQASSSMNATFSQQGPSLTGAAPSQQASSSKNIAPRQHGSSSGSLGALFLFVLELLVAL